MAITTFNPALDIPLTTENSWVVFDLNTVEPVPSGTTFAVIQCGNNSSEDVDLGVRATGSAYGFVTGGTSRESNRAQVVKVNASGEVELYQSDSASEFVLIAYGDAIAWLDTSIEVPATGETVFRLVDVSALPADAKYAVVDYSNQERDVRAVGDSFAGDENIQGNENQVSIVELNASREFEIHERGSLVSSFVLGWLPEGAYEYYAAPAGYDPPDSSGTYFSFPEAKPGIHLAVLDLARANNTSYVRLRPDGAESPSFDRRVGSRSNQLVTATDADGGFEWESSSTFGTAYLRGGFTGETVSTTPGIRRTLRDTDTGDLQVNLTDLEVAIRTGPRAATMLTDTATGTTDGDGVLVLDDADNTWTVASITGENVGTTDVNGDLSITFNNDRLIGGTIVLTGPTETIVDDGEGTLHLQGDATATRGTVDYAAGTAQITGSLDTESSFVGDYDHRRDEVWIDVVTQDGLTVGAGWIGVVEDSGTTESKLRGEA